MTKTMKTKLTITATAGLHGGAGNATPAITITVALPRWDAADAERAERAVNAASYRAVAAAIEQKPEGTRWARPEIRDAYSTSKSVTGWIFLEGAEGADIDKAIEMLTAIAGEIKTGVK